MILLPWCEDNGVCDVVLRIAVSINGFAADINDDGRRAICVLLRGSLGKDFAVHMLRQDMIHIDL